MKIFVNLSGIFRDIFEAPEQLEWEMPRGASVRDLLSRLCEDTGGSPEIFFCPSGLKPNATVTVNGRFIIHLNWLDTVLFDGDRVKIFTLHCGG